MRRARGRPRSRRRASRSATRASGLVVEPGTLTCLVSAQPHETAAVADRLGRFGDDDGVVLGGVALADLPLADGAPPDRRQRGRPACCSRARCATCSTPGARATTAQIHDAIAVANAEDVVEALPEGLDDAVDERGRSFSGGQRQRLALARALLAEPEILVLVEPTSAVDAHTEARIAARLREARAGRTTVVVTASPLVLDRADHVVARRGRPRRRRGHVTVTAARGAQYREVVTRGEDG